MSQLFYDIILNTTICNLATVGLVQVTLKAQGRLTVYLNHVHKAW